MRLTFSILLLLLGTSLLNAQSTPPISGGARSIGLGGTGLTFTDVHSSFTNQAGLHEVEGFSALVAAEQRFQLSELQNLQLGVAYATNSGTFGLTFNRFGFEEYREQRIGLAYGRKILEKLSIGGQLLFYQTDIPVYGNASAFNFEVGLQSQLLPQLVLGFHLSNPIQTTKEVAAGETIDINPPTVFRVGFGYLPSEKVKLLAEVEKDIDFDTRIRMGIEYTAMAALDIRLGVVTAPVEWRLGAGYHLKNGIAIDLGMSYHQTLGISPGVGLVYGLNK